MKPSAVETISSPAPEAWTIQDSVERYAIDRWGGHYFSVNDKGHIAVHPDGNPEHTADLYALVDELRQRGLQPPLLIRFTDILKHRLADIHKAFATASKQMDYKGDYCCVYPIKVNQQRHVVEDILRFGKPYGFGVEAGSKPELLAVMALVDDDRTPIICNGFKDARFIEAVILAAKIGKKIIPVVENFHELELIVKYAEIHNVRPAIGVRVKLAAKGAGRWEGSSGFKSKFGLNAAQLLDAVKLLEDRGMADCLKLLHCHIGSQINNITNIKRAIVEVARVFTEIHKCGVQLDYLDIGGGLGIDYDGSKSNIDCSINYSLQEYANDVVYYVKQVCDREKIKHPTIISESGRAVVAYHSVLIFNVLGASYFTEKRVEDSIQRWSDGSIPQCVQMLQDCFEAISPDNLSENFHDAQLAWDQTLTLFNNGFCRLEHRALAERLYQGVCLKAHNILKDVDTVPKEYSRLEQMLADIYFCNLSIFQSLPDSWAIDQIFPILPIHRLDEQPTRQGIIADITCDSDGKIDRFVAGNKMRRVLDLHEVAEGDPYFIGAFLVGAYQEILGDMHNLFGDTNAVHVSLDDDGKLAIDEVVEGDTVREVLEYVQFSANELKRSMRMRIEAALRQGKLSLDESRLLREFYEQGLESHTYLE